MFAQEEYFDVLKSNQNYSSLTIYFVSLSNIEVNIEYFQKIISQQIICLLLMEREKEGEKKE
jgi:hypothetical protein